MDEDIVKNEDIKVEDNDTEETITDNVEEKKEEERVENSANVAADIYDIINNELAKIRAEVISIKDTVSQFVDMGGVIREVDEPDNRPEIEEYEYKPIESLDLSL